MIIKLLLGTVVMGVASFQVPAYLVSLRLGRVFFNAISATSMLYMTGIPGYACYLMKEEENNAKVTARGRIKLSNVKTLQEQSSAHSFQASWQSSMEHYNPKLAKIFERADVSYITPDSLGSS